MLHIKSNEAGFSTVEALLVLVVIGILGFTGWFVWHAQRNVDTTLKNNAAATSPRFVKKVTKTVAPAPAEQTNTFAVKELGIKLVNVPTSLTGLTTYTSGPTAAPDPNNTTTTPVEETFAKFSTNSLTQVDPACSAKDGTSIGGLSRIDGTYAKNKDDIPSDAFVKQFSGFYIGYAHPQAGCSNMKTAQDLQIGQTATFQTFVLNADNIQAL